jgi:hypothetical protein
MSYFINPTLSPEVNIEEEDENVISHRVSMQTLTSAGGHFEFSNGANSNNTC